MVLLREVEVWSEFALGNLSALFLEPQQQVSRPC